VATIAELLALGLQYHKDANLGQAEQLYRQVLCADPSHADAHHLLGALACETGHFEQAVASIRRALTLNPQIAAAWYNLGNASEGLGQLGDAIGYYRRAIQLSPGFAEAWNNLGIALKRQNQAEEAVQCYLEALRHKQNYVEALANLGNVRREQRRLEEAAAWHRQALQVDPRRAATHFNLAIALTELGQLEEATTCYQQALRLKPDFGEAYDGLGVAFTKQGRFEEAMACFDQALHYDTSQAEAHLNRAILWLLQGDWGRGWKEYEWRWRTRDFTRHSFRQPLWDGSALEGRTILLHAEQGLGDTVHFIRYASLVKQRGGNTIVACQPPLVRLLAGVAGIDKLVAQGTALPAFDVQAPLLSLPGIFQTTSANVPNTVPYLKAAPGLVQKWRQEIAPLGGFKVGIAWQGNPTYRYDRQRSIPLALFGLLAQVPGVQLISLQKGPGTEQQQGLTGQFPLVDLGNELDESSGPFMDTAAIVKNVDLVISSDTVIAHLAGALAVPVWVALPVVPDWRWLLEREDSQWYPTMRLFRQRQYGHWEDLFDRMAEELKKPANTTR
jgi:tetratricopeptide (TPR) repeat protein